MSGPGNIYAVKSGTPLPPPQIPLAISPPDSKTNLLRQAVDEQSSAAKKVHKPLASGSLGDDMGATHGVVKEKNIPPESKMSKTQLKVEMLFLRILKFIAKYVERDKGFAGDLHGAYQICEKELTRRKVIKQQPKVNLVTQSYGGKLGSLAILEECRAKLPYELNPDGNSVPLSLSTRLTTMPEKVLGGKSVVAKAAIQAEMHKKAPTSVIEGVGDNMPYSFQQTSSGEIELIPGEVVPTSVLEGSDDSKLQSHLKNAYVLMVEGREYGVIRTSVIDTKVRADEFVALLKKVHKEIAEQNPGKNCQLRVVSHQLNTFGTIARIGGETDLIENQHMWMAYANTKMKDENDQSIGEIAHINTPCNRWYHTSQGALRIGKNKELKAKEQNLDAWGTYIKWIPGSIVDPEILAVQGKIQKALVALTACTTSAQKEEQNKIITEARKQIKVLLTTYYGTLESQIQEIENKRELLLASPGDSPKNKQDIDEITHQLMALKMLQAVLGSQLEIPGKVISRAKELMAIQMLNMLLGVTSGINCKSGLDRTALVHAIKLSMETFSKKMPLDRLFHMIMNWETTTAGLNKGQFEAKDCSDPKEIEQREDVRKFRNLVLDYLIRVSIPITIASTGLAGLKWSPGTMQENLVPLNFLPREVEVEGVLVTLVKYDSDGKPTGLTKEGAALLTKLSALRGK